MAKKEQEMYEGMPVIEASDRKALEKKLEQMESRPEKVVVRISSRAKKIKERAFPLVKFAGIQGGLQLLKIFQTNDIAIVLIPDSVTEIGWGAFQGCEGLTNVIIGNSVTEIGKDAFSCCTGLTSIVIPDSVTKIGSYAFGGCTGLTSIVIPDSVTEIGDDAFPENTEIIRK